MLQELGKALLTNQVPPAWSEQWAGPEEALAYCAATANRAATVSAWVAAMLTGSLWTSPLNLAHLFNPGRPHYWLVEVLNCLGNNSTHRALQEEWYIMAAFGDRDVKLGDVAHMVERSLCMREVQGSIPCISITFVFSAGCLLMFAHVLGRLYLLLTSLDQAYRSW